MKAVLNIGGSHYLITDLKKANRISALMQGAKRLNWGGYQQYLIDEEQLIVGAETLPDSHIKRPTEKEEI